MFHATKRFQILCSVLAQGALVVSTISVPNSGYVRPTPISNATTASNSLADILQYISAGWGTLTRTMNRCDSLEDTKTGPPKWEFRLQSRNFKVIAACGWNTFQRKLRGREKWIPIGFKPTGCCIWKTPMWCPEGNLTRCMGGIVISLSEVCFASTGQNWPRGWLRIFSLKSTTMAAC
jgi:hypothetical protein